MWVWQKQCPILFSSLLFGDYVACIKFGKVDLQYLTDKIMKRVDSFTHLKNVMDLAMLGTVNIAVKLRKWNL